MRIIDLSAPHTNKEIHRQEYNFEEDEEENHVLGYEDPFMPVCRMSNRTKNALGLPGSGM